ncbi:DUF5683 domain-containing protein [Flavobacterium sp. CLA17]|uniref:DUF5683 domain-containing protein n=1 Tax=Flavobacterium sp. CLA17 TaxID=2724135 RepID=UPI001490C7BF|nr:DUF5683 domain-containing protein [Flavobacterium sp. CLA17]QSB27168.1 hypothetical protein HAV12_000040 [Flavobacterium sp. CLA17]
MRIYIILILFFYSSIYSQSQSIITHKDSLKLETIDPLRPAKASFYSAILPGLGQVYNKKYWKVPLVYVAIGTSIYFYTNNQKQYDLYRDEYKNRLAGTQSDSEYLSRLNNNQLISAQKYFQRNRDLSAFFIVGFYVLNIIDANVDAALSQFNVKNRLAFRPMINTNTITSNNDLVVACIYRF